MRRYYHFFWPTAALILLLPFIGLQSFAQAVAPDPSGIPLAGKSIPKYVEPLPVFGPAGTIPRVDGTSPVTVRMQQIDQQVLPAPNAALGVAGFPLTKVWGYNVGGRGANYPGVTIEARRKTSTVVTYLNELPSSGNLYDQILTVDQTLHWADPAGLHHQTPPQMPMTRYQGAVPTVAHLHGGEVPSLFDGGPDAWFTPDAKLGDRYKMGEANRVGPAFMADDFTNVYTYPNEQEAATLFFHDHALGITRINLYAGLAAFYLIRDLPGGFDDGTTRDGGPPAGKYEIELAVQDRMFDTSGQLFFPNVGLNMEHPFWLPEFFGDVMVVNGKSWPYLNVEPRRYRFRIVNGSNARFYELFLWNFVTGTPGPAFWQIGTDGGLLTAPVQIDPALGQKLLLAPGERADIIVDFTGIAAGTTFTLRNTGKAPYPKGAPADPKTVGQVMQFRVGGTVTEPDMSFNPTLLPTPTIPRAPFIPLVDFATGVSTGLVDKRRQLTLNEVMGMGGPLEVLVNNTKWSAPASEVPQEGDTEIWQIINLTADAHPIHLHLVQFQLVSRQAFNFSRYMKAYDAAFGGAYVPSVGPPWDYATGNPAALGGNPDVTPFLQGPVNMANPNEKGWKDTFVMYPGEVTTVIVRFAPQDKPVATSLPAKAGLKYSFDPSTGPGYVWHCHIVDHEDNEMMRPYSVLPNTRASVADENRVTVSSVGETPTEFSLNQNYPNPFNPSTEIRFALPEDSHVKLVIYNSLGQEVKTLLDSEAPAGYHTVRLDARGLASGVYYYKIMAGNFVATKKMLLTK